MNEIKGIVLAGGAGTRLYPLTSVVCKQLLPVYDKPMIYYPITLLMWAGIRDMLIITTPSDKASFRRVLGDGSRVGVSFSYEVQERPEGIAQAFLIAQDFIGKERAALILGDNIFYGNMDFLRDASKFEKGALIFGYPVHDPKRYGVIEFNDDGVALSLEEKPRRPKSRYAVPGLYFYDNRVVEIAKSLKPSRRGELEITDVNKWYLERGELRVEKLSRGIAWLDMGTQESLLNTSNFIQALETRQGLKFGCIEEVSYRMGYIDVDRLEGIARDMKECQYRDYLEELVQEERERHKRK